MIMAGGTGGHVFPGLAVAAALRARDRDVVWLGTRRGLEARVVPPAGIDDRVDLDHGSARQGPARAGSRRRFGSRARSRRRSARCAGGSPAAVLGMGGFVAGPGGFAAWLTRRPLAHSRAERRGGHDEPAARAARDPRASRRSRAASRGGAHAEVIGNPVRATIAAERSPRERLLGAPRAAAPRCSSRRQPRRANPEPDAAAALSRLPAAAATRGLAPGRPHAASTRRASLRGSPASTRASMPFIDDIASAYRWADLVVAARARITLAELAASRRRRDPRAVPRRDRRSPDRATRAHFVARGRGPD